MEQQNQDRTQPGCRKTFLTYISHSEQQPPAAPFSSRALLKSEKGAGCQVTHLENQRGERERGFGSSQTLFQVFYMASFFYTLNYVWNLYKGIKEKYYSCMDGYSVQVSNRVSTAGKIVALVSCLLPVLLMLPVIIEGNISHCQANLTEPYRCLMMHTGALFLMSDEQPMSQSCLYLHTYHITIFLITVLVTLLSITVLVVKARCIYRRIVTSNGYLGSEQRASFSVMDRRMVLYPLVFVFCWGPAVILAFLRVADPAACQGKAGVVLYILQALTSASQGFFNCLVYGWIRVYLRRARRTVSSRDVDTQTPLLRAQKRRGYQTLQTLA